MQEETSLGQKERERRTSVNKSIVALRPGRRGRLKEQTAPRNLPSKCALVGQKPLHLLDSLKLFRLFWGAVKPVVEVGISRTKAPLDEKVGASGCRQ